MTTPYWDYSDSEEEISDYTEEEKFWEARKRSYLQAIEEVKDGADPVEALTKMWHTTIEWQDEPLDYVLKRILGEELIPQERTHRRIWQIRKEYQNRQIVKPKKKKSLDFKPESGKSLPFVTSELEEDFDLEEDDTPQDDPPSRRFSDEIELVEEEEEEDPEEDDTWLQRAKERASQPEIEEENEWETKKSAPIKRSKKTRRPSSSYVPPQVTKEASEPSNKPITRRAIVSRPISSVEESSYRLWTFDGVKFTPLLIDSEWVGSANLTEAKRLAEQFSAKLLPKSLITKEFNLWERDKLTGAIVPITYEHKDTLIHLGQDREDIAQKMIAAMKKQFNIDALILPKSQTLFEGFDLNYYNNFA